MCNRSAASEKDSNSAIVRKAVICDNCIAIPISYSINKNYELELLDKQA
jgi:hypothetical protein